MTIGEAQYITEYCKRHPILIDAVVERHRYPQAYGYSLKIILPDENARWANSVQDFRDILARLW
jgi:hypothetical protein